MPNSNTLGGLFRQLAEQLDSPLEAGRIIDFVTGKSRADQILYENQAIESDAVRKIWEFANRRNSGEPFDHIFGFKEFYGLSFTVNGQVLTPRPETELLIDFVLAKCPREAEISILDLGTGSGAIPIAILLNRRNAQAVAVDISEPALKIACENANRHRVGDRIEFMNSNWFEKVTGRFNFILSNPPYIADAAMRRLDKEVTDFDPNIALSGGVDGLDAYREIISKSSNYLFNSGWLVFEIGFDQARPVTQLLENHGFKDILVQKDLASHDRLVAARLEQFAAK